MEGQELELGTMLPALVPNNMRVGLNVLNRCV